MAKKPGLKSKKLFLAFLIIGLLINPIGLSQSAGQPAIKLFSILPNLDKLLRQKPAPYELHTISLVDAHPSRKSLIEVSIRGDKKGVFIHIRHKIRPGWLKRINYQLTLTDEPIKTSDGFKFGNITEIKANFSNNYGQNSQGLAMTVSKSVYFDVDQGPWPPAMLADLEKLYDSVAEAILNQDNDSIHQITHQLQLADFFQKHVDHLPSNNNLAG